mmetsp:Transcript_14455/g.34973  ORF Transcript_14455/g.34973 Transcript_14455/m.34973 type:complete len:244 (+) Transcript_14455:1584-2315(+)
MGKSHAGIGIVRHLQIAHEDIPQQSSSVGRILVVDLFRFVGCIQCAGILIGSNQQSHHLVSQDWRSDRHSTLARRHCIGNLIKDSLNLVGSLLQNGYQFDILILYLLFGYFAISSSILTMIIVIIIIVIIIIFFFLHIHQVLSQIVLVLKGLECHQWWIRKVQTAHQFVVVVMVWGVLDVVMSEQGGHVQFLWRRRSWRGSCHGHIGRVVIVGRTPFSHHHGFDPSHPILAPFLFILLWWRGR